LKASASSKALIITDLDNTLYDWVTFYSKSFQSMLKSLSLMLDVNEEQLISEYKLIHERFKNAEQPYATLELPSVKMRYGKCSVEEIIDKLAGCFSAFNNSRENSLKLYDSVYYTLKMLNKSGIRIVAHTESYIINACYRLKHLDIISEFHRIYATKGNNNDSAITYNPEKYCNSSIIEIIPEDRRKPNPLLIDEICDRENVEKINTWYIGDSINKDIYMAKMAGVNAVWARYGRKYEKKHWEFLVKITHWGDSEVVNEEDGIILNNEITPDFTIDKFEEILNLINKE
jgi:FMN phosphatase YigB (HAD superfamily)